MSARSHLSSVMFLVVILLGFTSQVVFVKSAVPPFSDPRGDVFDEKGKQVAAEPYLDIVLVDYVKSGSNYIFELTFDGALPDRADPSLWIDWGIMINTDKNAATGWGGTPYNNLGADLFIRLGMGKSGIVPQICELAPSFKVVDKPDCKVEGSKITFTVTSSIGTLIDSGCPWIAVTRKYESVQTERYVGGDKAPNEGYYTTPTATIQTATSVSLTVTTRTFTQRTISTYPAVNWTIMDRVNTIDWNSASTVVEYGLTWERISTKYFVLFYNTSRDRSIMEAIMRVDNTYAFMRDYSGVDVVTPIRIWLCCSPEVLERLTLQVRGERPTSTAFGDMYRKMIFIDYSWIVKATWIAGTSVYGYHLGIVLHELAHFFIYAKGNPDYYSWNNEIFCTYLHSKVYAYYGSIGYFQPLQTLTSLGIKMSFTKIVDGELLKKHMELYNVITSVLFFFSDVWSDNSVKVFWNALFNSPFLEALEKTFGQPVDELEKEWSRYYEESWRDIAISELDSARQKLSTLQAMGKLQDRVSRDATLRLQTVEYNKRIWNFGTAYVCAAEVISILNSGFRQVASEYVDLARAEIERARLEKRTVGLEQAEADLQRSQQLFQQEAYEQAYILASRASSTAKSASMPAMIAITSGTNIYVILLTGAAVVVAVLVVWKRSRKTSKQMNIQRTSL